MSKINLNIPKDLPGKLHYLQENMDTTEVYAHGIVVRGTYFTHSQVEVMLVVMQAIDNNEMECVSHKE